MKTKVSNNLFHMERSTLLWLTVTDLSLLWILAVGIPNLLHLLTFHLKQGKHRSKLHRVAVKCGWVLTASLALWFCNRKIRNHFSSKWDVYLMASRCLGMGERLNEEAKKGDGRVWKMCAHTCECKEGDYLPAPGDKLWGGKVQLKGKWKYAYIYQFGFYFSLRISGFGKTLALSCNKGWDLWVNRRLHIYW